MTPPFRKSRTWTAMSVPTRSWASAVAAPMCGVATTRGCLASRQSTGGSWAWTSRAAPATRPLSRAASSASSSISSPRAAFTMRTPGLTFAKASLPRRCRVSLVRVVWRVMKSLRGQQLVEGQELHVQRLRDRRGHEGVVARDLHARGRGSGSPPRGRCGPGRRRPAACRCSSTPANDLRSHFPAFIEASAGGDVARHGEEQGQGQLGGGHEVAQGRVHDHHAAAGGRLEVHVVDAHPGPADDPQVLAPPSSTSAVIWLPLRIRIAS